MQQVTGARFTVAVQLMAEPCLWRWEIHDPSQGQIVANSWSNEWMAYDSPDEAYRAGHEQLRALTRP
jgi:hypothetical protein